MQVQQTKSDQIRPKQDWKKTEHGKEERSGQPPRKGPGKPWESIGKHCTCMCPWFPVVIIITAAALYMWCC